MKLGSDKLIQKEPGDEAYQEVDSNENQATLGLAIRTLLSQNYG